MFPTEETNIIYNEYKIQKCFVYQNLTDKDSTSIIFVFICNLSSSVNEKNSRGIIFKVLIRSKILQRLDVSDNFWKQFDVQDKSLKKQVGLFEIENINNANVITIALNPKEYYEKYIDHSHNKKHKGLKRGIGGMDFASYSGRLVDLNEYCRHYLKPKKIEQKSFQILNESIQMKSVSKVQFGRFNDKRYYFYIGITSLPFGNRMLDPLRKEKQKYCSIYQKIQEKKYNFLKEEAKVIENNQRMRILINF